jgi:hypothetical protein
MAKPTKAQDAEGEITFTIVKFGLKGSDATLQKGVDTLKAALIQAGIVPVQDSRQLRAAAPRQLTNGHEQVEADAAAVDETEVNDDVTEAPPAPVPRPSAPRAKPKVKNYTAIADPGFNTTSPTLMEVATQKNPNSDAKKFVVIAYWFKHHLKQPNVSNEAFYTAFRTIGWTLPTDIAATVRELRAARDQRLTKGTEPNTSMIAHLGEKAFDQMSKVDAA